MRRRVPALLTALLLLLSLAAPGLAAGQVTDTLTVRVGYFGMETEQYAEVGTYHWSELSQNLPIVENAYSFFRSGTDGVYRTVIDSARGFSISDLMDYVNINIQDIQSIQFYTKDQEIGYFTSFTHAELFETPRYYFNDLSSHIEPVYNDAGEVVEYNADSAWNDCWEVAPMLALEDSWATYELGTEHTAPNYESMGTGNRFRLLFGQAYPTEVRTNQSAKYTHTLFVTLNGTPPVPELPELDGTIGSHTIQFDMSLSNGTLREALAQLLNISSSDSSVLEIKSVTVTPSSEYVDLATVTVTYEVHKEGAASLSIGLGGAPVTSSPTITTHDPTPTPTEPDPQPTLPVLPDTPTQPDNGNGQGNGSGNDQSNGNGSGNGNGNGSIPTPTTPAPTTAPTEATEATTEPPTELGVPDGLNPADTAPVPLPEQMVRMYALDDSVARQLMQKGEQVAQPDAENGGAAAHAPTVAPAIEERDDRLTLLLVALGAILTAAAGGAAACAYYQKQFPRKERGKA